MKTSYLAIIIILASLWSANLFSQVNIDCVTDPPLPPVLTSVSVESETGNTKLNWTLSPSPDIAAYIIYSYTNGDGMPLDTVRNPLATSFTINSTASKYFSVSYVVAAMRLPRCTSVFSNILNSIFETATIDTCLKKILVNWNSYPSVPNRVLGYSVLMSVNGSTYTEAASLGTDATTFTLNDFTINGQYCFVVRANLENGAFSTSNKTCISTRMQRPPQWINADEATIGSDGKIALSFTIDPLSEINHFMLERKTGSGLFQDIARLSSANGSVKYTDSKAVTNEVNYYRLSALNSCDLPVTTSNTASNIVLSYETTGNNIVLSWNSYKSWLGSISSYNVYTNTGNGFEEIANVSSSDTTYLQDYQQIMYKVTGSQVCFNITASEVSNPHGIQGKSLSSEVCLSPVEKITVPNVFTPNNDLKNDHFKPVLSFTPSDYHLVVTDRQGTVIFETHDHLLEWDGTKNGSIEPQGVYLWVLKVTTPSGKKLSRTGTVTIIK
jgi:gliding motility-associated-like protein